MELDDMTTKELLELIILNGEQILVDETLEVPIKTMADIMASCAMLLMRRITK